MPHYSRVQTGDAAMVDGEGYVHVMSRIDDVINVAGHRLSTGAIEATIAAHPAVAECAVVGPHGASHASFQSCSALAGPRVYIAFCTS